MIHDGEIERLLPLVDEFVTTIDLEAGVVTVDPPEGLPESSDAGDEVHGRHDPARADRARARRRRRRPREASRHDRGRRPSTRATSRSDKHRTVDDTPYGGGPGMVMKPEPLLAAIAAAPGRAIASCCRRRHAADAGARPRARAARPPRARVRSLRGHRRARDRARDRRGALDRRLRAVRRRARRARRSSTRSRASCPACSASRPPPTTNRSPRACSSIRSTRGPRELDGRARARRCSRSATTRRSPRGAALQAMQRTAARRPDLWRGSARPKADAKAFPPLAARTHLALVHHPVVDRTGTVITTALTNFDIHDLARSSMTYGLAALSPGHAGHVAARQGRAHRAALDGRRCKASIARARSSSCAPPTSIETVIADAHRPSTDTPPVVVATSARSRARSRIAPRRTPGRARRRGRARSRAAADPARDWLGTGRRADSVCISRAYADRRRLRLEPSVGSLGRRGPPRPTLRSSTLTRTAVLP